MPAVADRHPLHGAGRGRGMSGHGLKRTRAEQFEARQARSRWINAVSYDIEVLLEFFGSPDPERGRRELIAQLRAPSLNIAHPMTVIAALPDRLHELLSAAAADTFAALPVPRVQTMFIDHGILGAEQLNEPSRRAGAQAVIDSALRGPLSRARPLEFGFLRDELYDHLCR